LCNATHNSKDWGVISTLFPYLTYSIENFLRGTFSYGARIQKHDIRFCGSGRNFEPR